MRYISIILFLIYAVSIQAQVVNIEAQRTKNKKGGIQGNIDLSIGLRETGKQIIQGTNNIKLQYNKGKSTLFFFNDLSLMQVDGEKFLNDGFQHLRYNYRFIDKFLTGELFAQHQYNSIKKLNRRVLFGGGPRIKIMATDTLRLFVGVLGMYEYEEITTGPIYRKARMSSYLSITWNFAKIFTFNSITYYQPNFAEFGDFRVTTDSDLMIKITGKLSFKILFSLTYDSNPPDEVETIFYNLTNGISFKF